MNYYLGCGRIPYNLDLDLLLVDVKGNVTFKRKIKEGIVYFLSLLSNLEEYPDYWLKDGYFILNDARLAKIVGKGGVKSRTAFIKSLLIENNIVESIPYKIKERSMGFRFTKEYNSGEYISVPFGDYILNNLKKYEYVGYEQYVKLLDEKYSHLTYNVQNHRFNILQDELRSALTSLVNIGLDAVKNKKKYKIESLRSLFSYIGKNIAILNKLVDGDLNVSVSTTNNRLYSVLTQVPRIFRRFLQIDNCDIGEVDIKSCQLYLLACILKSDFSISEDVGFNLHTIYDELYQKIKEFDIVNPSRQIGRSNLCLGIYFNDTQMDSISEFTDFDFSNNDFYEFIYNSAIDRLPILFDGKKGYSNNIDGRISVKSNVMNYLFDDKEISRETNNIVYFLGMKFNVLEYFLTSFFSWYSKRDLAILLQRSEAYLVLEKATKIIYDKDNSIPIFTIHDCVISTTQNLDTIKNNIERIISSLTGKKVGVKTGIITKRGIFNEQSIQEILSRTVIDNNLKLTKFKRNIRSKHIELAIDFVYNESVDEAVYWKSMLLTASS